jgi:HKD family nuclease
VRRCQIEQVHYSSVISIHQGDVLQTKFLTRSQAQAALLTLIQRCDSMDWAVAWATPNEVVDVAYKHASKFRRLILGTHFYQTDPDVLERFSALKAARMMLPKGATFHPKLYLFRFGQTLKAVVGSHNLTESAFTRNAEISVFLEGATSDPTFDELTTFVADEWARAKHIADHLHAYRVQHAANRKVAKALEEFVEDVREPLPNGSKPAPFRMTWGEFESLVKKDRHHSLERRLEVLAGASRIFAKSPSLVDMTGDERKSIAGTYHAQEAQPDSVEWALFGTMVGQGDFKKLVNDRSPVLSRALDHIPLEGDVTEDHYRAYIKDFRVAFDGATHKGGVPTATRLLALKRPDRFVAVNDANKKGVCRAFGAAYTTLHLDNYWERIAVPLTLAPFWRHPPPRGGLQRAIWDGRAALLDSIYYDPKAK